MPDLDEGPYAADAIGLSQIDICRKRHGIETNSFIDPCLANERRASNGSPDSRVPAGTVRSLAMQTPIVRRFSASDRDDDVRCFALPLGPKCAAVWPPSFEVV